MQDLKVVKYVYSSMVILVSSSSIKGLSDIKRTV